MWKFASCEQHPKTGSDAQESDWRKHLKNKREEVGGVRKSPQAPVRISHLRKEGAAGVVGERGVSRKILRLECNSKI